MCGIWKNTGSTKKPVLRSRSGITEDISYAVALGLNTDAVCVIMDSHGTVVERRFIDFPAEKTMRGQYTIISGGT